MKSDKKKIVSWAAVLLCMAVIFILSAQKGEESQELSDILIVIFGIELSSDFVRTCAHFLEYAGLSVLVYNRPADMQDLFLPLLYLRYMRLPTRCTSFLLKGARAR